MLTEDEKSKLSLQEQISKAEEYHELEFVKLIQSKLPTSPPVALDMGCGYSGLLRRLVKANAIGTATGCDISTKMCEQSRVLNETQGLADRITILEDSYLQVNLPDASCDLIVSMDALLHVGPTGQKDAMKEAARILRPGGWMIFSDIMQQEEVDADEMQPIYNRIHLSKMGTVSNYKECMECSGFINFEFLPNSSTNVSNHYGTVCKVLEEKGDSLGISKEYQDKMKAGLEVWHRLGTKNIVWGFIVAQKKQD
jgi:sarcosine/dimethylglycine N-methyltransferase